MSFLVEDILLNREVIKNSKDIEDDDFNDLLIIERCIKAMYADGRITKRELINLDAFSIYKSRAIVSNRLHETENTVSKMFRETCDKIAFELGSYFTDEGFLDHMEKSYNLDQEQSDILQKYMKSSLRHSVLRRRLNNNEFIQESKRSNIL